MQAKDAREFLRMLDPEDWSYGVKRRSESELDTLKRHLFDKAYTLPGTYSFSVLAFLWKRYDEEMKVVFDFYNPN